MVYPRFTASSFWNYRATCEIVGAKYPAAPLGLITVAALLPADWTVRLVNRNTGELADADLEWADLVMTGGMLPQQRDTLRVIEMAQTRGKPVVVGGPDVSSSPHIYEAAEFRVLGEAEEVMSEFVEAWRSGAERARFEARGFPDVTKSPVPRFDLLDFDEYLHVGVQYSRGCPFKCEFCDIIELYGRVPRFKTAPQMLKELEALYDLGYRGHVDFVDDNFIGNKKSLKVFLPELGQWLASHGYPFEFTTEASINLADDPALLALMKQSNFFAIFVGIESPDTDTLVGMQKLQNTRRILRESIARIYDAGIFVNAGFIVGFDTEKRSVAQGMIDCIEETAIPVCMVGLLYALPNTQLTRRLLAEGRLHRDHDRVTTDDVADQCTAGLNFEMLRPRRDALADYREVVARVYEPGAYFARVRRVGRALDCSARKLRMPLRHVWRDGRASLRMLWRTGIRDAAVRRHWWWTVLDTALHNPRALRYVFALMALYLHMGPFSRHVTTRVTHQLGSMDRGEWSEPETIPVSAAARDPNLVGGVVSLPHR